MGGLGDRMVKRDRSKEASEREAEWKQVNGELGWAQSRKKGNVRGKERAPLPGWLACERAANVCLKETVYTADSARGSRLTDESANTICHHDLEHNSNSLLKQ